MWVRPCRISWSISFRHCFSQSQYLLLHWITSLDLSGNSNLKQLPIQLARLSQLSVLKLSNTPLFHSLDLSRSNISTIPRFVSLMTSLEYLNLSSNNLIGSQSQMAYLSFVTNLLSLDLSFNNLRSIPIHQLKSLKSIQVLNVSGNCISEIPPSLLDSDLLPELQLIVAKNCSIKSAPISWATWSSENSKSSFKTMDLSDNPILDLDCSFNSNPENQRNTWKA